MLTNYRSDRFCVLIAAAFLFLLCAAGSKALAQSTALEYPTPITTQQITGKIVARAVGDSRLTSHYYLFESSVGDVVVNIEATNMNGDIDIYTAGSMRPVLNASVYSSDYASAIQRDFYLRLPSRLILRVQGRTPGDEPATYKITFSGAFRAISAAAGSAMPRAPEPKVSASQTGEGLRATSTGQIVEKPKPTPTPTPKPVATPKPVPARTPRPDVAKNTPPKETKPKVPSAADNGAAERAEEAKRRAEERRLENERRAAERREAAERKKADDAVKKAEREAAAGATPLKKPPAKPPADSPSEPMFLLVEMKDGTKLRYAMSDVFTFSVDNGSVKIVLKNGRLINRRLLDVKEIKIGQ